VAGERANRKFLPATTVDGKAVVKLKAGPLTFLEEGEDFLEAYQRLRERIIGKAAW
jgi:hypothetical protein